MKAILGFISAAMILAVLTGGMSVSAAEPAKNTKPKDEKVYVTVVEGDYLEKILPDCVQISGSDSDENKEAKFIDF